MKKKDFFVKSCNVHSLAFINDMNYTNVKCIFIWVNVFSPFWYAVVIIIVFEYMILVTESAFPFFIIHIFQESKSYICDNRREINNFLWKKKKMKKTPIKVVTLGYPLRLVCAIKWMHVSNGRQKHTSNISLFS